MRLELGEISDEEFGEIERDVLVAIREIKGRQQGPISMSPDDKITGVDIQSLEKSEEVWEVKYRSDFRLLSQLPLVRLLRRQGRRRQDDLRGGARRARAAGGDRVLIVSTDPAHSLGDALGVPLSSAPRRINRSLDAVELDAPRAFARWLKDHRRPLGEILEHGTWLDREDVDALLDLSIPGVDELMGILEIDRLASRKRPLRRDLIVVDTAPTGHTLRLLAAPETVAAVADVLGELQQEHRLIREQLARVGRPGGGRSADRGARRAGARDGGAAARSRADRVRLGHAPGGALARGDRRRDRRARARRHSGPRDRRQPRAAGRRRLSGLRSPPRGRAQDDRGDPPPVRPRATVHVVPAALKEPRGAARRSLAGATGLRAEGSGKTPISHQPSAHQPQLADPWPSPRPESALQRRVAAVLRRQRRRRQDDGRRGGRAAAGARGSRSARAAAVDRPGALARRRLSRRGGRHRARDSRRAAEPGRPRAGRGARAGRAPRAVRRGARRDRVGGRHRRAPAPRSARPS